MTTRRKVGLVAVLMLAVGGCNTNEPPAAIEHPQGGLQMMSWTHVTVGVADLDTALALWTEEFGFDIRTQRDGPDEGLAKLWGLDGDDAIARQAVVGTPGVAHGLVHLVQFTNPGEPVRAGAEVFDLLPKNLDIHVKDLPANFARMKADGRPFRSENYSEVTAAGGTTFREIHMHGHDDTNIVFVEVIGEELPYSPTGFAGIGPIITIVPDAQAEEDFYVNLFALEVLSKNLLNGEVIERMVGLPKGAGLDVRVLGEEADEFGRIEIVDYQGVEGEDRYARAVAPSLGTLHIRYEVPDLVPLSTRLQDLGIPFDEISAISSLLGTGDVLVFRSPAGLRIEAQQIN
ncbi:MAG: VOC family protein [Gammaproteobacteria bacterium]